MHWVWMKSVPFITSLKFPSSSSNKSKVMDGRTDGEADSSIPPPNIITGGIKMCQAHNLESPLYMIINTTQQSLRQGTGWKSDLEPQLTRVSEADPHGGTRRCIWRWFNACRLNCTRHTLEKMTRLSQFGPVRKPGGVPAFSIQC